MRIFLDNRSCEVKAENVGEAIAAAASLAEEEGRMIAEVQVDGEKWGEKQLGSRERLTAPADTVRLTTAEPHALVVQALADSSDALRDASELQTTAAEHIHADEHQQGMSKLQEALSIWMGVQQAVTQGTQLVGIDLDTYRVGDEPVQAYVKRLNQQLETLRNQLEAKDHLGLADTLLYELPRIVEEWRTLLQHLQQHVEQ